MYYFDSSAVVKRYVLEPGSVWIRRLWNDHAGEIHISWLTVPETAAAFAVCRRKAAQGEDLEVDDPFAHVDLDSTG